MKLGEKVNLLVEKKLCDSCFGRQFANLLTGYTNRERGQALRLVAGMKAEWEEQAKGYFPGISFHRLKRKEDKPVECELCGGLMDDLDSLAGRVVKKLNKLDFSTFLIGTKLSYKLLEKEETLWEDVGIDYCESLKAEVNREVGKRVEEELEKEVDFNAPDVVVLINLEMGRIEIDINPLFISGYYKKKRRGIPQTKWPSGKYKNSLEEMIARPVMKATKGKAHKFHGCGREDIDARCLAWRPFILEILEPKKRNIDLKSIRKKVNRLKSVNVKDLEFATTHDVAPLKEKRPEKTYRCEVVLKGKDRIDKKDLKALKKLKCVARQETPQRVLHRRADKVRKRKVREVDYKYINSKRFRLEVRGEAGLYVKELVTGDDGRSKPSVSGLLGKDCKVEKLDVIGIHMK